MLLSPPASQFCAKAAHTTKPLKLRINGRYNAAVAAGAEVAASIAADRTTISAISQEVTAANYAASFAAGTKALIDPVAARVDIADVSTFDAGFTSAETFVVTTRATTTGLAYSPESTALNIGIRVGASNASNFAKDAVALAAYLCWLDKTASYHQLTEFLLAKIVLPAKINILLRLASS